MVFPCWWKYWSLPKPKWPKVPFFQEQHLVVLQNLSENEYNVDNSYLMKMYYRVFFWFEIDFCKWLYNSPKTEMQVTVGDGKKIKLTQDMTTMTPDGIMTFRKCLFDFLIIWISNPAKNLGVSSFRLIWKECLDLFWNWQGKHIDLIVQNTDLILWIKVYSPRMSTQWVMIWFITFRFWKFLSLQSTLLDFQDDLWNDVLITGHF